MSPILVVVSVTSEGNEPDAAVDTVSYVAVRTRRFSAAAGIGRRGRRKRRRMTTRMGEELRCMAAAAAAAASAAAMWFNGIRTVPPYPWRSGIGTTQCCSPSEAVDACRSSMVVVCSSAVARGRGAASAAEEHACCVWRVVLMQRIIPVTIAAMMR